MKSIGSMFRSVIRFASEMFDRPESSGSGITSKYIGLL